MVFFDNDEYALRIIRVFKQLQYEYSPANGKPTGFKYEQAKDLTIWSGLKPRAVMPILNVMFQTFIKNLPAKK